MRVNAFCAIGVFFFTGSKCYCGFCAFRRTIFSIIHTPFALICLAFYGIFIEIVKINSD